MPATRPTRSSTGLSPASARASAPVASLPPLRIAQAYVALVITKPHGASTMASAQPTRRTPLVGGRTGSAERAVASTVAVIRH